MTLTSDMNSESLRRDLAAAVTTAPIVFRPQPAGQNYVLEALTKLWCYRRFILKAACAGLIVATVVAFLIPSRFESTTRLMPPDSKTSASQTLSLLTSKAGDGVGSVASGLLDMGGTGALFIGVLQSTTVQDRLIGRFDLRKEYGVRLQKDAREQLAKNTAIFEDRKSKIISVVATDKSPQRAAEIAQAYVEELNRLTAELTTSAAHRERVFLEQRLATVKQDLDADSKALSDFSVKNSTLDLELQGKAMVSAAATLEGQLIATEAELGGLKQIYSENNFRVRSLEGRAAELKRQMRIMAGSGDSAEESGGTSTQGMMVPMRRLPKLGLTYFDLLRRAKMQEAVFEVLTKQYELAKVEEERSIPVVRVLDAASIPERKSSPHRLTIMLTGGFLGSMFATMYLLAWFRWQSLGESDPTRILAFQLKNGVIEDVQSIRSGLLSLRHYSNGTRNGNT